MTREEAISVLKLIHTEENGIVREPLNMAIKALETVEEFEKAHIITGGRLNGRTYAYKCGLEDGKRKALDQEPRKGKWIKREILQGLDQYCECSNCGSHCLYEYVEIGFKCAKTKYCPNCGAEMESEE